MSKFIGINNNIKKIDDNINNEQIEQCFSIKK